MRLQWNVLANFVGQGWRTLISIAFVPLYLRYLGPEAYGLIGIFTILLAWLCIVDTGLRATLSREMARFTGGALYATEIRDVLRTVEVLVVSFSLLSAGAIWACSNHLAGWVHPEHLSHAAVATAFATMGVVVIALFAEGMYLGSLSGLQRQVLENGVTMAFGTVRAVGAFLVIALVSPTVEAFFWWQALTSLASFLVARTLVYRLLPAGTRPARFSRAVVASAWRFTTGVSVLSLVGLLAGQIDKLVLSRTLSLAEFGYYALSATAAGFVGMLSRPIVSAYWPRFAQYVGQGDGQDDGAAVREAYHVATQLVTVLAGTAAALLVVFPDTLLLLWTHDVELTAKVAPILRILALGCFLQTLAVVPNFLQMAYNWTSLAVASTVASLLITTPALYWAIPAYGTLGASWTWTMLMGLNLVLVVAYMHRRILPGEARPWFLRDVLGPAVTAGSTAWACGALLPRGHGPVADLIVLAVSGGVVLIATTSAADRLRGPALARARGMTASLRPGAFAPWSSIRGRFRKSSTAI